MTGRFDRYLLSQLLMLFGFFALVLVLVYWVNRAVVLFDQLIANGQSAAVFLEITILTLPNVIRIDLPIAAFAGTPCGVEGDAMAVDLIEQVLASIGAATFRIPADKKPLYHAAAVFSNNFATVLQAIAREAWQDAGVPDEIAEKLNASLLTATVENVTALGPQAALTGPAARGDTDVLRAQAQAVTAWNPQAGHLYDTFSEMARRLKETGSA